MASSSRWSYIPLEGVIAAACCLGNVLVIWAVRTGGALRQPTFCFITALAVADFLVGSAAIPLSVLVDIHLKISFHACVFMCCAFIMVKIVSVALLLAIAVDRFLRVYIPFRYKSTVTHKRSWMMVVLCWGIAAVWGYIPLFGWNDYTTLDRENQSSRNSTSFECSFMTIIPTSYLVNFIFFSSLLPSLVIMAGLYLYVFLTTRRQLRAHIGETPVSSTDYHKEHKLAISLALVLVLICVCWLPLFIILTVRLYVRSIKVSSAIIHSGVVLSHVNSALNPIVYAFRIPKIKETCMNLWRRFYHKEQLGNKHSDGADCNRGSNAKNISTILEGAVHTPAATHNS
ncbi:adenosine receptor A1-like [Astyanax mexicanus]|uniref:Adenosine receptor A1-like n=1 Tax=Astyanax mexicanus TaxID=7994 RepID=A0A8T2M1Q1_ASTMX|nr:adenosine receptor A1-like [Astyanax mexicanus]